MRCTFGSLVIVTSTPLMPNELRQETVHQSRFRHLTASPLVNKNMIFFSPPKLLVSTLHSLSLCLLFHSWSQTKSHFLVSQFLINLNMNIFCVYCIYFICIRNRCYCRILYWFALEVCFFFLFLWSWVELMYVQFLERRMYSRTFVLAPFISFILIIHPLKYSSSISNCIVYIFSWRWLESWICELLVHPSFVL